MNTDLAPTSIVIFGITGDLAQRKILPALYHLLKDDLLHKNTEIIGISRRDVSATNLLEKTELCVIEADKTCDKATLDLMKSKLSMQQIDPDNPADYDRLHEYLKSLEKKHDVCMNRLFYLSIPPQAYAPIVRNLGERGLNQVCEHGKAHARLLVEKPFGYDLASAEALIQETGQQFKEEQLFRIDHYLAKETAQNILAFRFNNPIFEKIWDQEHITSVDVLASEEIDIEGRAGFYDEIGALRDLIQSHMLQLLALTTMEQPKEMTSDDIHTAKLALLESVAPVPTDKIQERTVRGQYEGYRDEVHNPHSLTETYAGITLFSNTPRWQNIPMTLRTGKALKEKKTTISLTFKREHNSEHTNTLTFHVQPNEGISIDLLVKRPGFDSELQTATMDFSYERTFDEQGHPDAYERVLVDAIRGDHTLFATSEEVLASWRIVEPVIQAWAKDATGLASYKKGSNGPAIE